MVLTYALLTFAILALWFAGGGHASSVRRHLWLFLFCGALVSALFHEIVRPLAFVWIAGYAAAVAWFYRAGSSRGTRLAAAIAIVVLAAGLMTHQLPGFANPRVIAGVQFTSDAIPFRLHLNFDKTVVGLFLLGFGLERIASWADWRRMFRSAAPIAGALIGTLMLAALAIGYVRFDSKFPAESWLWLWVNLCFTCLAEEALFRGFVQTQLQRLWSRTRGGNGLALAVAAMLFGVAHAAGGIAYVALATLAGLGYGWVFQRTGRIEASILTHFALNATHFFFFTYPALTRAG